jgi:integrase
MIITAYQPSVTSEKTAVILKHLEGYLENDIWDLTDLFFTVYGGGKSWSHSKKNINFTVFPSYVRFEVKFFFANQLVNEKLTLITMTTYSTTFNDLSAFLKKYYPLIESLIEIYDTHFIMKYKTFLANASLKFSGKSSNISLLNSLFNFLYNFYDTRDEVDKDVWDLRRIPAARYTMNRSDYLLSFKNISPSFRKTVKDYCKFALTYLSQGKLYEHIRGIACFVNYIQKIHPEWNDFQQLKRVDIEKFLIYFLNVNIDLGQNYKRALLSSVNTFLEYLQRSEHSDAPQKPVSTLFFREDFPKIHRINENKLKYIPDSVMFQLESLISLNPEDINPPMDEKEKDYVPIVILLMTTGWRISDLLNLRFNNCLISTNSGYYLQGDIPKTNVKQHRVPIANEVAMPLQTIIEQTKEKSTFENNPEGYLFVRTKGKRKGKPFTGQCVQRTLNRWAEKYSILDQNGNIYHFGNHAFRHTKGVELINLGMNLTHIMKWFAHASPEMTLVYAKIADDTLRKEWEKAQEKKSPLLRVDLGDAKVSELNMDEDLINWEYIRSNIEAVRVPLGYCLASKKEGCPYVITPCLTCPNFCTTTENLPDFDREIKKVEEHIEMTKNYPIYNEKTQEQLDNLKRVRDHLAGGKMHRGDLAHRTLLQAEITEESVV